MRLSLIRRLDNGSFFVIDEQKSTPRLASRIDSSGNIDTTGIHTLILHLKEFQRICESYKADEIIALGTAALRQAQNREQIVQQVKETLGLNIEIISGGEEAFYGYNAVSQTMVINDACLIDIGGGSTEIALVQNGRMTITHSFPFGAVTLNTYFQTGNEFEALPKVLAKVQHAFQTALGELADKGIEVIGIGGTVRNIASIHQARTGYALPFTHNYTIPTADAFQVIEELAAMTLPQRKKLNGLSKGRADLIVPGGAILLSLLRFVNASRLRVSGRGLRDGVYYARVMKMAEVAVPVLQNSVKNILGRYNENDERNDLLEHRTKLALQMFKSAAAAGLVPPDVEHVLYTAAQLHRIGVRVDYYHYENHTFYLLLNSAIYGLSHREVVLAAMAASYNGKTKIRKLCSPYIPYLIKEEDLDLASRLGVFVKIAEALDRRHERRIQTVDLRIKGHIIELHLPNAHEADVEWASAQNLSPHVKKIFGKILHVVRGKEKENAT